MKSTHKFRLLSRKSCFCSIAAAALFGCSVFCTGCSSPKQNASEPSEASTPTAEPAADPFTGFGSNLSAPNGLKESMPLTLPTTTITTNMIKGPLLTNPLISNIFCADPTAVEYNGRLYVYGTNDEQQYQAVGKDGTNTYEKIQSLVMLSTEDMVNWTYHGIIDTKQIAPWIIASWAPSIVSRVEADGLTHFYLYFSNSGWGTGVLTATDPLGPWTDPLGHSLVDGNTPGLGSCSAPFDPGVVIDDDGVGWLSFGGGGPNKNGTEAQPGNARIVKLGEDMLSLASDIVPIPAPYHFEANELNYINGTYVYTYNNSWKARDEWSYTAQKPGSCSMSYMTTKTPLNPDSWVYQDSYFNNPGTFQMGYSNNHTHLQKFKGKYYLFYHAQFIQNLRGTDGGFRSLCVDAASVDEETVTYKRVIGTKLGVTNSISPVNPYQVQPAASLCASADISYIFEEDSVLPVISGTSGCYTSVKAVQFDKETLSFAATVSGKGRLDVYADHTDADCLIASIECQGADSDTFVTALQASLSGTHDLFFVLSGEDLQFESWQFGCK